MFRFQSILFIPFFSSRAIRSTIPIYIYYYIIGLARVTRFEMLTHIYAFNSGREVFFLIFITRHARSPGVLQDV